MSFKLTMEAAVLLLALFGTVARAQMDCSTAPKASLKLVCEQLQRWDAKIRDAAEKLNAAPALPPGFNTGGSISPDVVPTVLQECVTIPCACTYLPGGQMSGSNCVFSNGVFNKVQRKEYRLMTDDERNRYHAVLNSLRNTPEYIELLRIHAQTGTSGSAHSGPGFLPWHRDYEFLIRRADPTLYLPYWDSTLDGALPNPADSILFSEDFMGFTNSTGYLTTGPFRGWSTLEGRSNIRRELGAQGECFTETDITRFMAFTSVDDVLASTAPQQGCTRQPNWYALEYSHGGVHVWIGGDMLDQSTSANDPIFFLHHSFVDLIWEQWRLQRQNREDRETAYPLDNQQCTGPQHFVSAIMRPFSPMQNIDGLLNAFTDNLYSYAPRPICPICGGSPYLFCDLSHGTARCAAKVRLGGNCTGFTNGETVCYNSQCSNGVCIAVTTTPPPTTTTPRPAVTAAPTTTMTTTMRTTTTPVIPSTTQAPTLTENCFNENQCCSVWAGQGECTRNKNYMDLWCPASCGICTPRAYNLNDECSDRHINCARWSSAGECRNNPMWMSENCRRSCNLCGTTRAQACGATQTTTTPPRVTTTPPPAVQHCTSSGCYNEYECCPIWAQQGECRNNATFMSCNCRVSCGVCSPVDYRYGACNDYHKDCPAWAYLGECSRNPWMLENCRYSCRSCPNQRTLTARCPVPRRNNQRGVAGFGGFNG